MQTPQYPPATAGPLRKKTPPAAAAALAVAVGLVGACAPRAAESLPTPVAWRVRVLDLAEELLPGEAEWGPVRAQPRLDADEGARRFASHGWRAFRGPVDALADLLMGLERRVKIEIERHGGLVRHSAVSPPAWSGGVLATLEVGYRCRRARGSIHVEVRAHREGGDEHPFELVAIVSESLP